MAKFFEGHYYAFREGGKDEFLDFSRYSIILTDASRVVIFGLLKS